MPRSSEIDSTNTYLYGNPSTGSGQVGRIAQTNGSDTEYFLGDALGSVRQLTDAGGAVTLARNYDPFGSVTVSAGSAASQYGYTGEQQFRHSGVATTISSLLYHGNSQRTNPPPENK